MADATEDAPPSNPSEAETPDLADEVQDFRFLTTAAKSSKLHSRGTKDFEPHGTNKQQSALDASREAMHTVLSYSRIHKPSSYQRAVYDEVGNGAWCLKEKGRWSQDVGISRRVVDKKDNPRSEEEIDGAELEEGKATGAVGAESAAVLGGEEASGTPTRKKPRPLMRMWLLPEEALWLLERGTLDIRWPAEEGQPEDEGLPMSLQAAYAAFIGMEDEGGLTLENFKVYQYLKRAGFTVLRAKDNFRNVPARSAPAEPPSTQWDLFRRLWGTLFTPMVPDLSTRVKSGPLVANGLYRSYDDIYRLLLLIPFHDPRAYQELTPPISDPSALDITYHVYKAVPGFKKTLPGPPDFYISVLDANKTALPTGPQFDALLLQTPYHPPDSKDPLTKKLKHGYRNVLLAIVDQGVTSFLNISDAGFGCEKIWGRASGPKRGGFRGGKGGRGRGRDR